MEELRFFPDEEYTERLQATRRLMAERELDGCMISAPENIYYLTGLSHQGFFAYHMLIVPLEGEIILIARAMEGPTVEAQVNNARFMGYLDTDNPAGATCKAMTEANLSGKRIGIEKSSMYLTVQIAESVAACFPKATWSDATGLVDDLRTIKSPRELTYTRQAVAVADAMMRAAIDVAQTGINERDVAAEVYRAMVMAGGEYPGFNPFIRSTPTLAQEHAVWNDRLLMPGDALFVELAGCVRRYHAAMGRLIFVEEAPEDTRRMEVVCLEAFDHLAQAIRPGVRANEVYDVWQQVVDDAGLSFYRRHHCGYLIGIGFPPSWTGGNMVVGLRPGNDMELQSGMVFHVMSWLMGTKLGDYFVSETAIVTDYGCELLSTIPRHLHIV